MDQRLVPNQSEPKAAVNNTLWEDFNILAAFCTREHLDWNVGSLEVKSVTRFDYMSCLLELKFWNLFWPNFQHFRVYGFHFCESSHRGKGGGRGIILVLVWYQLFTYQPDLGIRYSIFSYQPGPGAGTDFWLACDKIISIFPIP
jgi:hypothetical protein